MSELNEEKIKQLSQLCRIAVSEKDVPILAEQLKRVIDYIEQLKEVDVSHLSPYAHIEAQEVISLRDDIVEDSLSREKFLANAPDTIGGMVKVPPVIQK